MSIVFSGLLLSPIVVSNAAFAFDEKKARKAFKKCTACHEVGIKAESKVGPHLNGLNGRVYGSVENFKYSKAFKKANNEGRVWDSDSLNEFLKNPSDFLEGNKMNFSGIKKEKHRTSLVQWLLQIDADGESKIVTASSTEQSADLLGASAVALEGDIEYGEYLAGECVTCHKIDGSHDGLPNILGWPKENFIHVLYEYKTDVRENPVMRTVAKRLGDEEMAALAAYFGSLKTE